MTHIEQLIAALDELLQPAGFRDLGPNGLQVPGAREVTRVVTGVSARRELCERAVELGAQLVLVHHGLFWDFQPTGLSPLQAARLRPLFKHDISLAAYHLPLDAHPEVGNNALICGLLGVGTLEPFAEHGGQPIGWIGSIDPAVPLIEVVDRVRRRITPQPVIFEDGPAQVSRIAVVSGSAAGDVVPAANAGADCFVTGELKEQVMSEAREAGISVIGAGHYRTEVFGVQALGERIAERFGVEHRFVDIPNPV